ncbi:MAG TPA: penicillin-binding transpeptidase domain-containing protein [Bryobacteraceae bacterium]|nr:penicillin-binding transpeptidase domain-containing protein [Bryobacteraceae bacterium]
MTTPIAVVLLAAGLFEQSVTHILRERFPHVSFVLLDIKSGAQLATNWKNLELPVPPGSLVKPFLAAAAPATHAYACESSKCWSPTGHGTRVNLVSAIAHSCNAYFRELAAESDLERLDVLLRAHGLPAPRANASTEELIGLGRGWQASPRALALAYARLLRSPAAQRVREGMRMSAHQGTGKLIGIDALVKTATAPCAHPSGGAGDGYTVAAFPANEPRYLLLVQRHGTTGSQTAQVAGQMLRVLRDGK